MPLPTAASPGAPHPGRTGFTIPEVAVSLLIVISLLAILLPALSAARVAGYRETCKSNQRQIGAAWFACIVDNDETFPLVGRRAAGGPTPGGYTAAADDPSWGYGGVRFNDVSGASFIDFTRPLTRHLPLRDALIPAEQLFRCPGDSGITGETGEAGTGRRTAFRSYGTSYRAVAALCDCQRSGIDEQRGLHLNEIATDPSRMAIMGDPLWYEVLEDTGRRAAWHGDDQRCNVLHLDGSVRYVGLRPRSEGPTTTVFDPEVVTTSLTTSGDDGQR